MDGIQSDVRTAIQNDDNTIQASVSRPPMVLDQVGNSIEPNSPPPPNSPLLPDSPIISDFHCTYILLKENYLEETISDFLAIQQLLILNIN